MHAAYTHVRAKGGNADPVGDAIQDGDYHDLLDQNGGPEGF